jgi:glycosyltransferase involved in cell wall biosynthesis
MIAVIVPVHNEEDTLAACLQALLIAAAHPSLAARSVQIVVVLDACTDASAAIAARLPVVSLAVALRNVGAVRAAGAAHAIGCGAEWLANTDADTVVSPDWLWQQIRLGTDAVCGTVSVEDWGVHGVAADMLRAHFARTYTDADNHRHIHGANFGVSVAAYHRVGGFPALACSEDVALVESLLKAGASIAWSAAPRVITSARVRGRAVGGFADTLVAVVRRAQTCSGTTSESTASQ